MLACLITHAGDRQLTVNLAEHIAFLGGVQNHECLIVTPEGTNLNGIEDVLRGAFGAVHVHYYRETMRGWPFGANEACAHAMTHILANPALRYHYLMLEPDCVPMHRDWLNHIDIEYRRAGMPVMGVKVDTKKIAGGPAVGRHVVGVAVYPKNFPQICRLVGSLESTTRGYYAQKAIASPWDAMFGPYTVGRNLAAETKLIQHFVRQPQMTEQGLHWDLPLDAALQQVNRHAALVHGCKDPAFLRAVAGKAGDTPEPVATPEVRKEPPLIVAPTPTSAPVDQAPVAPAKPMNKTQLRIWKEEEKSRIKNNIVFEQGTPQFLRAMYFYVGDGDKIWKAYAKKMDVKFHREGKRGFRPKGEMICELVRLEEEQGVELWTKALAKPAPPLPPASVPVEEAPSVPKGTLATSSASRSVLPHMGVEMGDVDGRGNPVYKQYDKGAGGITGQRAAQMQKLLKSRSEIIERVRNGEEVKLPA